VESRPAGGTVIRLVFPQRPSNRNPSENDPAGRSL
jgi:hypothetical protein